MSNPPRWVRALVGGDAKLQRRLSCCAITLGLYAPYVLLLVVLVFCAFALTPRQAHGISLFAIVFLGAAMRLMNRVEPQRHEARQELANLTIAASVLAAASLLSGELSRLRRGPAQPGGLRMTALQPAAAVLRGLGPRALPSVLARLVLLAGLLPAVAGAETPLPRLNLLVEWRETDATPSSAGAGAPGWNVRSGDASAARERPAQRLLVLNGASASLRLSVTRPVQVWQTLPGGAWPVAVPGTQWIEAGQQVTVQPRWPGGAAPVSVTLSLASSRFDPTVAPGSAQPPQRGNTRVDTVLQVPLGEWVSVAGTGANDADRNVVSSGQAAAAAQRVLQLRVSRAR